MAKFKDLKIKLKVKAKKVIEPKLEFPKLKIESGIFSDTRHYAKNITAPELYSTLLYGSKDGRIPSRNVLDFLTYFIEKNKDEFVKIYLKDLETQNSSFQIGSKINDEHKKLIYNFRSPSNAISTIKQKGFNDPLINTGTLVKSVAFSINDKGRYGKG